MAYLVAQIFVCLLLAALLGGLVGWLLRGRRAAAPDALASARRRIETLEQELDACRDARQASDASADAARDAPPPAGL